MKKLLGLLFACSLCFGLSGCGGNEGGSVIENADQSAIDAYEAEIAAEEEAMSTDFSEGDAE